MNAYTAFWKNLSLRGKVLSVMAFGVVPAMLCLAVLMHLLITTNAKARWVVDAGLAHSSMLLMEVNQLQWINAASRLANGDRNAKTDALPVFERCILSYWLQSAECRSLRAADSTVNDLLDAMEAAHTQLHKDGLELLALLKAGKQEAAYTLYHEEILPAGEQIVHYFRRIRRAYEANMEKQHKEFAATMQHVYTLLVVLAVTLLLWTLLGLVAVRRSLTQPLRHILRVTQRVSGGDRDARTNMLHKDEIGQIANNLDKMIDVLQRQYMDIDRRAETNSRLVKRLHALTHALQALLLSSEEEFDVSIAEVLGVLGSTLSADRAYIWANRTDDEGGMFCDQIYAWSADHTSLPDSLTANVSYADTFPSWYGGFSEGKSFNMRVSDCEPSVQSFMLERRTKSFLVAPIFLHDQLWGFLGIDDCHEEHVWSAEEEDFVWNTGVLLSASILHHQTEANLGAALVGAEEATKAKAEFLARMSHEIRTPLNAIIGLSYLALQERNEPRQEDFFRRIQNASSSLLGIVNDVLDFSRIEAQKLELESAPFSPCECLQTVLEMLATRAAEKGIDLSCDASPQVPRVLLGDSLRMRQVLTNLVSNAVKFTERGGVLVELIVVNNNDEEATLRFSVSDTGIGMTEAQVNKLFQPFSQTDGSITRRYGGSGLGLVISRDLIEKMGGNLHVKSVFGEGSSFYFTITLPKPAAGEGVDGGEVQPEPEIPNFHGRKALVVDDNDVNQLIMSNLLELAGMDVDVASDGQQAVDIVKKCGEEYAARGAAGDLPYDIILMDVQMPVMDGLQAAENIRKLACGTTVPIIALTAHTTASDYAKSLNAGMNDHITKPVEPAFLYRALAQWMDKV